MIQKRLKRILKLGLLIAVRQTWKLLCNLYQLRYQPFLTVKTLLQEKDKSQIFLLCLTAISPIIMYATARYVWDHYRYGELIGSVGTVFAIVLLVELLSLAYLAFWVMKVIKKGK